MATETLAGPLGEIRAASAAGGGTQASGTALRLSLPLGSKWVSIAPNTFSTAVVLQYNFNPWLTVIKTADLLVTEPIDYSIEAQDGSTSTSVVLSSLGTAAQGDFLYVGSHTQFSGVAIDVDAANGTASVLTVKYWDGNSWEDISATDGTDSGGASMATDGSVTWTIPAGWATTRLFDSGDTDLNIGIGKQELFWTRWEFSAALDSSTTLDSMLSINRSTAYAELASGFAHEQAITVGPGGIASVTLKTDAGTCNAIVNVAARGRFA